jgi:hypothetical protein
LSQLAYRPAVAIVLRCVVRVRPVFRPLPDDPYRESSLSLLSSVLGIASRFAAGDDVSGLKIIRAAKEADALSNRPIPGNEVAAAAAALARAVKAAVRNEPKEVVNHAATALFWAGSCAPVSDSEAADEMAKLVAGSVLDQGPDSIRDPLASDYESVVRMKLGEAATLGGAIDPSPNGPLGALWPDGPPDWYPR